MNEHNPKHVRSNFEHNLHLFIEMSYKDQIVRVAAHRHVDNKTQYKIYWKNHPPSWEPSEAFSSNDPNLQEYWLITDTQYVEKAVQTEPYNIPCQSVHSILGKTQFKDILKDSISTKQNKEINSFTNVIVDSVDLENKKVVFHTEDENMTEIDLDLFKFTHPKALALYFIQKEPESE